MRKVLFASTRPIERAENISAIYNAYDGPKDFVQTNGCRRHPAIRSGAYDLMVIDEFPTETPGKCIMLWHSVHGGKTIGIDQPHPYYHEWQKDLITYLIASGNGAVESMAQCSGIPKERVLPYGLPRTDVYVGKKKGDGHTVLAGKKAWLYAPTFRTREETPMPGIDWEWLDEQLTDDEMIAVKMHPESRRILTKEYKHIVEISPMEPSAPYLYDCDAVVTDYSTIIFDGWMLGKPAVLLEKQKGYTLTRGMYLDYPVQYTNRYCTNEQEMLNALRNAGEPDATERDCLKLMADMCDGNASQRVCELIRKLKGAE